MKVIVIGAVAAGMSSAAKLKRNLKDDVEILVFEKGTEISYGACGIPFYVMGHIEKASDLIERTTEDFASQGIDLRINHEVISVDFDNKTVVVNDIINNKSFSESYDKLIIGSGASVRRFAPMDQDFDNLLSVRKVADGTKIKELLKSKQIENVVIVGAGFIGLEMIEAAHHYGVKVHLIEAAPQILSVMDSEFSQRLVEELTSQNVDVYEDTKLTEIKSENGKITSVIIEKDGNKTDISCDLLLNCAGIQPETRIYDKLEKAANGAIIVNDKMETNIVDVYAAGDCSIMKSFITNDYMYAPLGTNANKQGRIIADVIANKKHNQLKLLGSSAMRLFSIDVAKVGLTEKDATRLNLNFKTTTITGNNYASYYGSEKVTIKLVYDADDYKLLGAQLIGQGVVVARANYFAMALTSQLRVDEIGFTDLCYSPPFGGVWDVALIAANSAK